MNPMQDLPMGFGMALLQDPQATRTFYAMFPTQQREILLRTHTISSKAEMRAFVASLSHSNGFDPSSFETM